MIGPTIDRRALRMDTGLGMHTLMKSSVRITVAVALICTTAIATEDVPADASSTEVSTTSYRPAFDEMRDDPIVAEWLEVGGTRVRFYGFPRVDAAYTDSRLVPNNQFPFWAFSEDPTVQDENDEEFEIYVRLTRLGIDIERDSIPYWEGAELTGRIEIDFHNGGSESREAVRMRHAWLKIRDGGFSLLGGQTWDLVSPLRPSVHADALLWNTGNTGDRRPQIRIGYDLDVEETFTLNFAGAIARQGAINNRDLDGDGTADGIDSGIPMLQARVGVADVLDGAVTAGVWAHYAREDVDSGVAGETRFSSHSYGADLLVRVTDALSFAGEVWTGENLDDIRGGIGQGINTTTGEEIESQGGWAEVRYQINEWYRPAVGFAIDDPEDDQLDPASTAGGGPREKNHAIYLSNRFDFGGGLKLGVEYIHWETEYAGGLDDGDANRIDVWMSFAF